FSKRIAARLGIVNNIFGRILSREFQFWLAHVIQNSAHFGRSYRRSIRRSSLTAREESSTSPASPAPYIRFQIAVHRTPRPRAASARSRWRNTARAPPAHGSAPARSLPHPRIYPISARARGRGSGWCALNRTSHETTAGPAYPPL